MKTILKLVIPLALLVAIPIVWWKMLGELSGARSYLMATGLSVFLMGGAYRALGSMDLIPDWIPLIGKMDDMVAWLAMLLGVIAMGVAYYVF